jgi:O-antigen/teichoic acid export membrane protein
MVFALPPKHILKNMFYLYSSFMLNHFLRALYLVLLARIFGAELYGLLAFGQTWYTAFLPFCGLGLGTILIRKLAADKEAGIEVANQIVAIQIISISLFTVICFSAGVILNSEPKLQQLLVIYSIALMARGVSLWSKSMFVAFEKPGEILKIEKYIRPSEVVIGVLIAFFTKNILLVAAAHAFLWWLQAITELRVVNTKLQHIKPYFNFNIMKKLVVRAFPLGLSSVLNSISLPLVIISYKFFGAESSEIANVSIDIQAFVILLGIFLAIGQASTPALRRSMSTGNSKLIVYAVYSLRLAVIYGLLAGIMASYVGEYFITFILGDSYYLAGKYLYISMFTLIPAAIVSSSVTIFDVMGKFYLGLIVNAIVVLGTCLMLFGYSTKDSVENILLTLSFGYVSSCLVAICILVCLFKREYTYKIFPVLAALLLLLGYYYI